MLVRIVLPVSLALIVFLGSPSFVAAAATRLDDVDIDLDLSFNSGIDGKTFNKTVSTEKLKPITPVQFSATKTKGSSTSAANLDAAVLFDGSRLSFDFNPSTLVSQIKPINNKPAILSIGFDDFDFETKDKAYLTGFLVNDFILNGTVAPGGYAKLAINLKFDAEGPGTNIDDRRVSFSRTFTSSFSQSSTDLFGPNGLLGVNLSNRQLKEFEIIEGSIKFEVLGGASAVTKIDVADPPSSPSPITTLASSRSASSGLSVSGVAVPEPATMSLLGGGIFAGMILRRRR